LPGGEVFSERILVYLMRHDSSLSECVTLKETAGRALSLRNEKLRAGDLLRSGKLARCRGGIKGISES